MEFVAHQIVIVRTMKGLVKLVNIAGIITADIGKFQKKNHSHHHDGNGKRIRRQNRKI
jgi:hypothetical protein